MFRRLLHFQPLFDAQSLSLKKRRYSGGTGMRLGLACALLLNLLLIPHTARPVLAAPPTQDVEVYTAADGLYTVLAPPGFMEEEREIIDPQEVAEVFPGFEQALVSALIDAENEENVIGVFFLQASAELAIGDPANWSEVTGQVTDVFLWEALAYETLIDDPEAQFLRLLVETEEATFFADVHIDIDAVGNENGRTDDGLVILAVAGGPDWPALEEPMRAALDSFTWDRAAVFAAWDSEPSIPTTPEPEVIPAPDTEEPDTEEPDTLDPETTEPEMAEPADTLPVVPGFLDDLQRLEDPEGIFTAYAPARLQGETSAAWEGDVYTVYHVFWAAGARNSDDQYEEVYSSAFLGVAGPVNQIMAGHADVAGGDLPAPSFEIPTLEEWQASLAVYEETLALPADTVAVRYAIPGDEYGVLYYHEAVDENIEDAIIDPELEDAVDDESYRMWTYITQQDGVGFIVFLLGPLAEPDLPLHADPDVRFPTPIDLGLESFSWDLDVAKAALLDRLASRYTPAELAALTARPFADPLGGFTMHVPPTFTDTTRTLEHDAYAIGFRDPRARNGIYIRLTDLGETLTPAEWQEVLDTVVADFGSFFNLDPDDPAPEILSETVAPKETEDDYNYAVYELAGTMQHGLLEFVEIDGLFALAAGLTEPDDWEALEDAMRHALDSILLDSDVILANLAQHDDLPAALLAADIEDAPSRYFAALSPTTTPTITAETTSDITAGITETITATITGAITATDVEEAAYAPFALYGTFADFAENDWEENLVLLITGPDGEPVGQIGGLLHDEIDNSHSLTLNFDSRASDSLDGEMPVEVAATLRFIPAAPWQPGDHRAWLYYAGVLLGEFGFTVTGYPPASGLTPAIRDISLVAVDRPHADEESQDLIYAPEDTLRYRFNLRLPAVDHQVRLFVYHEGRLIQRLTHAWHLPTGALDWMGYADLRPAAGWEPGDYALHLWVNDGPWDVTHFTVHSPPASADDTEDEVEPDAAPVVPLTPATAPALALQIALEPVEEPEFIHMAFVDQGRALATLNLDHELVVYDTRTWDVLYRHVSDVFGWHLATDAQGTRLAVAYQDTQQRPGNFPIVVWDTASWTVDTVLYGHAGAVTALSFDAAGDWLISAAMDNTLRAWSLTGGLPTTLVNPGTAGGELAVTALDLSADSGPGGGRLALVYSDGVGEMWRVTLPDANMAASAATLNPLYTFEIGGRDAHELEMFPGTDVQDAAVAAAFEGPPMLIVGGNEVQVWTYYDQVAEPAYVIDAETDIPDRLVTAALSADAQLLVAGGDRVLLVETATGEVIAEPPYTAIQRVDVSAQGQVALLDGAGNLYILAPEE